MVRREYDSHKLEETFISKSPFLQFEKWYKEAMKAGVAEPNAMTLATATKDGYPSARIVLLRGYSSKGFVFYTNYNSRKGKELTVNPNVAINFFWPELERQLRIDGKVSKISARASDLYFAGRPRGSQLGAWASDQSRVIESRVMLEEKLKVLEIKYKDRKVPRPLHWGGLLLEPLAFEFWQGRASRLHDRICYLRNTKGKWEVTRLAP